jgi:iron-sulfur cluster assembly protein
MINLTPVAEQHIKTMLATRGKGIGIRVGTHTTGCSGLSYVLEYVDVIDRISDESFAFAGFHVVIDKKDLPYLDNMTVDYVRQGLNEGFEFKNPNSKGECGCGESFRV